MLSHWAALLPAAAQDSSPPIDLNGVAVWALQFSPRVALSGERAVLLEVEQSLRLFGGEERVHSLVEAGASELGITRIAWAPIILTSSGDTGTPQLAIVRITSVWLLAGSALASPQPCARNRNGRAAVTLTSFCRSDPAAARRRRSA